MGISGYNRPQRRRDIRRGLAVFFVLASLMILLADRQQKSMLASGRLAADDVSSKVLGIIATPVRGIEALFASAAARSNAFEDAAALRKEVERLRVYESKVLDMEMRVRRFEDMLSFDSASALSQQRIIARTVSESKGLFVHSALINAGRNKGVKPGYAVMTTEGLYGHIVRTGAVSARVLLLNDINSRISVMDQRSQSRAIMVGGNSTPPKLEYVALSADWQIGDRVITSGDGGVLPRGLAIGKVIASKSGGFSVDLFNLQKPIDLVWVYPYAPIANPDDETVVKGGTSPNGESLTDETLTQQGAPQ